MTPDEQMRMAELEDVLKAARGLVDDLAHGRTITMPHTAWHDLAEAVGAADGR